MISDNVRFTPRQKSGSVLLVTVLMVSLLLVIVLSFVAVVRMELRQVVEHQHLLQSRSNARLGLELAISKLQESAGPDTRVTAPAFPGGNARPNSLHIGQALDSAPFIKEDGALVLNADYARPTGYFISHGRGEAFDPGTYWPYLGGENVEPGTVLLVGPGSTLPVDENNDGVPDGYVAAPLREVSGVSAGPSTGQYAYHIRDNGLHAQINVSDSLRMETGGQMNLREQRVTAQRVASEFLLPHFDPDNETHNAYLGRILERSQFDLTPFVDVEGSRALFHGMTLQSLGLPVNVKTGGFRRDLTAVIREAEDNGGLMNDAGDQWNALMDFQTARMQRWRDQTLALEGAVRPSDLPRHRWNAINAITLREDQNQPDTAVNNARTRGSPETMPFLREKIFPPMSDLWITVDPGGANWRQLLTYPTRRQRLNDGNGNLYARRTAEASNEMNPVIARFAMNFYFTMEWPIIRLHFVPVVVLWNPYSEPLRTNINESWYFVWAFEPQHFTGWHFIMQVSNPAWRNNEPSWFGSWLNIPFRYEGNNAMFAFEFENPSGGSTVTLPPGEAVMFSMHQHEAAPVDSAGYVSFDYRATLRQGLHDLGGYSFYAERDIEEMIKAVSDINQYNRWGQRLPIYRESNPDTHPYQSIAANTTGLSPAAGWDINETVIHLSGRPGIGSTMRNRGFYFLSQAGTPNWGNQLDNENAHGTINYLYQSAPSMIDQIQIQDLDDPDKPNILPRYGSAPPPFNPAIPLDDSNPAWPGWGVTWSLRMPNPGFSVEQTSAAGETINLMDANFNAPSRWLIDHNPTSPYQVADPVGINHTNNTRGGSYRNPASYVGGFSLDPNHFDYVQMNPENTDSQFIGLGDDIPIAGGDPRLVLYDVPRGGRDENNLVRGSEDIASIAAFMHARPHSVGHAWAYDVGRPNRLMMPRHFASGHNQGGGSYPGSDSAPNSPVYIIGNSFAGLLVPRDRVTHGHFPGPAAQQSPAPTIPYSQGQNPISSAIQGPGSTVYYPAYDLSWIYNEVLWDDFMLTPHANRRLIWKEADATRDFNTSAENLLISGAFNVNSTSVSAWAAMLGSMLDVELSPRDGSSEVSPSLERAPLSRFLDPLSAAFSPNGGQSVNHSNAYAGYRRLTQNEIYSLAEQLVEQVKRRGPFLSISEFVNRMLTAPGQDPNGLGLAGALQTAINDAGLNDAMGTPGEDIWQTASDFQGSWHNSGGASAFHGMFLENVEGPRTAGSPGYLLQSDVLARIGGVLQARSDTFTVRAYGSLGDADSPSARSWVEATVQRVADFVDDTNTPDALPDELTALNQRFGRQFRVISFRWLSRDEI